MFKKNKEVKNQTTALELLRSEFDTEKKLATEEQLTASNKIAKLYNTIYKLENDQMQQEANIKTIILEHKQQLSSSVAEARADSLARSRSTMRGQATEHLAPLMTDRWNHKDLRFLGNPIDYLICDGASDITDSENNEINEIVLLEIKTGKSKMNKVQRRIRDAIQQGKVSFCIFNPDTNEIKEWKYENNTLKSDD